MKRLFITKDGKEYTSSQIKKFNHRIIYWVNLEPKGIEIKTSKYITNTNLLVATTAKKAWKLATKYNAVSVERMFDCEIGRWCIKAWDRI